MQCYWLLTPLRLTTLILIQLCRLLDLNLKFFSSFSNRNQILTYIQSPCNVFIFHHFHDILALKSSSSVYTKNKQYTSNPELPLEFPHNSDKDTLMFILSRFWILSLALPPRVFLLLFGVNWITFYMINYKFDNEYWEMGSASGSRCFETWLIKRGARPFRTIYSGIPGIG